MVKGTRASALAVGLLLVSTASETRAEVRAMPQFVAPGVLTVVEPAPIPAFSTETKSVAVPAGATGKWPVTLDDAKAQVGGASRSASWSAGEIAAAKSRCGEILKRIHVVAAPEPPLKNGSCGAPAPIRLVSIGRNPEVAVSPPAVVTCELAESLHTWVTTSLQPLAKRHLSSPLVKMEVMSDYSCRNAYGRAKARLSEHGRANALDIRSFVTAKADAAEVLAHWGPTERDMRAQIAAANAAAAKAAAARATAAPPTATSAAAPAHQSGSVPATAGAVEQPAISRGTIAEGISSITSVIQGGVAEAKPRTGAGFSLFEPARLGGPKTDSTAPLPRPNVTVAPSAGKARFLREAHISACRIFGTALGPEANNAHRNHFHVDAAVRASGSFCQ